MCPEALKHVDVLHRPPEVRPGVAKALALLAQAEAQAIFAHRADVGNKSRLLLAGLYVGSRGVWTSKQREDCWAALPVHAR